MDKAIYTKVRFKCKKGKFIAPLLTKKHTDLQFSREGTVHETLG